MNIRYTVLILLFNNICDPMEDACWLFLILNTYSVVSYFIFSQCKILPTYMQILFSQPS